MKTVDDFIAILHQSVVSEQFVKLTLSKPVKQAAIPQNIYVRPILLKGAPALSFTFRYPTRDEVKNYAIPAGIQAIAQSMGTDFLHGALFTLEADINIQFSKKRKVKIWRKPPSQQQRPELTHDKQKERLLDPRGKPYLRALGIVSEAGQVKQSGQKKWRQINKYIEIIDGLVRKAAFPVDPHIVDMGSGKGYLTFALYDYLKNHRQLSPHITGLELRPHLVDFGNTQAQRAGFEQLSFVATDIEDFAAERIDMLIALHACDTATDIAIAKGITAQAQIIVVAPCCHKQIRQQLQAENALAPLLDYGILKERQAELLTDGIRALLLEAHGYQTKVFEFISSEHTAKNVMIVGVRKREVATTDAAMLAKVEQIKADFGIDYHYLEKLLKSF